MGPVESFHTLRLLSHPNPKRKKVSRIFLMHNGLNELRKLGLYYEIGSHLIAQDENTVCLVRPFPGHLSRCSYPGLSETPLDHYLWDGLHLFRQFLRYMIETRWLLSCIGNHSTYRCVSGSGLLLENDSVSGSRLESGLLAREMQREWKAHFDASKQVINEHRDSSPRMCREPDLTAFKQAIASLRRALGPRARRNGDKFDADAEPELHVIGYSLGGFTAQSVFMSWPFLVSSCSTLLSGGAMRELAPTAFADPEEWQTVLHSLRYELDDAMMDWRFQQSADGLLAGINLYLFLYLKRTFYEVFEQEYRGSFQSRLVAFRQRMLFVVGGNDPIVQPRSVLDSGPPDGINMLSIGGLGHFLADSPQGPVERAQRDFWVPEIARTIGRLAGAAAKKHRLDLAATWLDHDELVHKPSGVDLRKRVSTMKREGRLTVPERLEVQQDGNLRSTLFQRSIDDLLSRAAGTSQGLLFILRNEPPTFLLSDRALQQHASALYHDEDSIVEYVENVRTRRALVENSSARGRICIVLPGDMETIIRGIDAGLQHPSQSESSGEMEGPRDPESLWTDLKQECTKWTSGRFGDTVRIFHAPDGIKRVDDDIEKKSLTKLRNVGRSWLSLKGSSPLKPSLPDCWIWMSNEFLGQIATSNPTIKYAREQLCETVPEYVYRGKSGKRRVVTERKIAHCLQRDDLRMVSLSRARYNPRFRGRIVGEPRQAQELLLRAALCIVASVPFRTFEAETKPEESSESLNPAG